MSNLEIWLLAVSLAMDCFSVSITSGIILRRVCMKVFLTIAFFFGLFQGMMPVIGWFGASRFYHLIEQFDHWIAFGLLFFLGVKMVKESFDKDEEHHLVCAWSASARCHCRAFRCSWPLQWMPSPPQASLSPPPGPHTPCAP